MIAKIFSPKAQQVQEQNETFGNVSKTVSQGSLNHVVIDMVDQSSVLIAPQKQCSHCNLLKDEQLVPLCGCKVLHTSCLQQFTTQLRLQLGSDLKSTLQCQGCKCMYTVAIRSQFNFRQGLSLNTFVCSAFSLLSMVGALVGLLAVIGIYKEYIQTQPFVFALVILATVITFIFIVWLSMYILQRFQVWVIQILPFRPQKKDQEANLQQIELLSTIKQRS